MRTATFPPIAVHLRNLAKTANDPNKFLLDDLPAALSDETRSMTVPSSRLRERGMEALLRRLSDLMGNLEAYATGAARPWETPEAVLDLRERAEVVRNLTGNYRLDAFATRLASYEFAWTAWSQLRASPRLPRASRHVTGWIGTSIRRGSRSQAVARVCQGRRVCARQRTEDRRLNVAIYTSDWRKDAPVRAEVDLRRDGEREDRRVGQSEIFTLLKGFGREVALAVVAELGGAGGLRAPQPRR